MTDTLRIKRRVTGAAGAPASLANAEIAYNEVDNVLYYGQGTGGSGGSATSIIPIAGQGAYLRLTGGTLTGPLTINPPGMTFNGIVSTDYPLETMIFSGSGYNNTGLYIASAGSAEPSLVGFASQGTIAAPTPPLSTQSIWRLSGRAYDGSAWSGDQAAIMFKANGVWSTTNHGTFILFMATPLNSTTRNPSMVFNGTGHLVIGTNDPTQDDGTNSLQVLGGGRFTGTVTGPHFVGTTGGGGGSAAFIAQTNGNATYTWWDTSAGADAKKWDALASGGVLYFRALSDNEATAHNWMAVVRSGANLSYVSLSPPVVYLDSGKLSFNNAAASSPLDLSRGIDFYGGTYGFAVSPAQLNYLVDSGGAHVFYQGGNLQLKVSNGYTYVYGNGIGYPGINAGSDGHNLIGFTWTGSYLHLWVDGYDNGLIATQNWTNSAFLPISGGTLTGALSVQGNIQIGYANQTYTPNFIFRTTGNGADQNLWDMYASGTSFVARAANDAYTAANNWLQVWRSGYTISQISMFAGNMSFQTNQLSVGYSGQGYVALNSGGSNPGYFAIYASSGARVGYVGFTVNGSDLCLQVENGAAGWTTNGTFRSDGNHIQAQRLYVPGNPGKPGDIGQGVYIHWNVANGDGGTWIMNQKGGGGGGFVFAETDTSGNLTWRFNINGAGAGYFYNDFHVQTGQLSVDSGILTVGGGTSYIMLQPTYQMFRVNNLNRWAFEVYGTESSGNAGSDLWIERYADDGSYIDVPLKITRSNGTVTLTGQLDINNNSWTPIALNSGSGTPCMIQSQSGSDHTWWAGTWAGGAYWIRDSTAGANAIVCDSGGNKVTTSNLQVSGHAKVTAGFDTNSVVASNAQDTSGCITLWDGGGGSTYGFAITGSTLNYNTVGAPSYHDFYTGAVIAFRVSTSGNIAYAPLTLPADPTSAMQATTKQYVDAKGPISVLNYGAVGDGTTDDTAAFNNAIATGKTVYIPKAPNGSYLIKGQINCTTFGQIIYGDGKGASIITVNSTFNMSATGVFVSNVPSPFVPGPQFRDFQINFVQPDTNVRANLTNYPPAFYAQVQARCVWRGIKINAAMIGIDIRGNSGGCSIIDCELAAFTYNIMIDGSLDSITVENTRIEPDMLTSNQCQIFFTGQTVGIFSGRCDDLHVNGCLLYVGTGLQCFYGTRTGLTGPTIGNVTNTDFDTYNGFSGNAAYLGFSGCLFTMGASSAVSFSASGGTFSLSACTFYSGVTATNGQVLVSPASGASVVITISGCQFQSTGNSAVIQAFANSSSCMITISGCMFSLPAATRTNPAVVINSAAQVTFQGNRFNPCGSGTGPAFQITWDNWHNVTGNSFNGWSYSVAGTAYTLVANNN